MPPTPDLSFTDLDEFANEPVVENSKAMSSKEEPKIVRKNDDAPIIEEWVSDSEEENVSQTKTKKKIVKPSIAKREFVKPKQQEKTARKTVKQVEKHRQNANAHNLRGNKRNWNNMMSQRLESNFEMFNKACYMCGSFDHLHVDYYYHQKQFQNQRMGNPQMNLQDQGVIDSGCSRHMTRNMSYLIDYEEIDRGYVAFGGNPKGGKIIGKGKAAQSLLFTWVFFLATKDETSVILKSFITGIENLVDLKVKFSVARTPQQNEVTERMNMTLIKAAKTMLADSKISTTFWAEVVNTACYVQNRVLVVKPHNKTPYKLFHGRTPTLSFMRPFGCPVTILNTIDHLGKFDGKADEVSLFSEEYINTVRYNSLDVFAIQKKWLMQLQARKKTEPVKNYILLPLWTADLPFSHDLKSSHDDGSKPSSDGGKKVDEDPRKESECNDQEKEDNVNSTNNVNAASTNEVNVVGGKTSIELPLDPNMPALEDYSIFDSSKDDEHDDEIVADINNLDTTIQVSPNPTTRIHKDHPLDQVIEDLQSATQTRNMSKNLEEHGFVSTIQQRTNHKDLQNCLFACFLSQEEPKKLQEVWTLVDLPNGKRAIGSKWVFRNKKDERGIVIRNKARLVAQGYTQEEGIDYDEVFAPVARIEAIRLFLAYASFKDFVVYQIDVKSAFLYGKIEEEVYVCQPLGFEDPNFPDRVYKVEKALYGLHQAPRAWYETLSTYLLDNGFQRGKIDKTLFIKRHKVNDEKFQMSSMGELTFFLGLQVQQKKDGIFISQDKYVVEILKKFGFTEVKTASTPMETQKPLLKDEDGEEVDVYMYRSMIVQLKNHTSSDMTSLLQCCITVARYQVNPKHTLIVIMLEQAWIGSLQQEFCQSLGCRLISWQCKKQTVVANSTTEAEYVAASSCCGQALWIQNQLLDYGRDLQLEDAEDKAVHKELGGSLVRTATTASSLEAEHDSGGPRCQETMGDTIAQTRFENVSKHSNDPLLARGNTLRSGDDNLKLTEMMELCTNLQTRVLDLEKTKTTQANKIASLNESSGDEDNLGEGASKQGRRINDIDADDDITLVNVQDDADNEMFDANALNGEEVFVVGKNENVVEEVADAAQVSTVATTVTITTKEITLAQALKALKTSKPRLAREKAEKEKEANIALIEEWDVIQAKIDANYQLAETLQAQEQEELSDAEKATLF
ncbi:putative ribonuclease H-like domain-containing protein [Tanacetum coccineum]